METLRDNKGVKMENELKRILEINGVKIEVDLRTAKRVDEFKVGSKVKLLKKTYSGYTSHFGMIVAFDEFKSLPTIVVAYLEPSYSESPLKFEYLNSKSEDVEICGTDTNDIGVDKGDIIEGFTREITKKEVELKTLKDKLYYFEKMFGKYFS